MPKLQNGLMLRTPQYRCPHKGYAAVSSLACRNCPCFVREGTPEGIICDDTRWVEPQ